jgi:hypothetical protein
MPALSRIASASFHRAFSSGINRTLTLNWANLAG